jgi:hypothetical protein
MDRNTISYEVNNKICEAYDCFAEATTSIRVKIGHKRTMMLDVCKDCVSKFREDQEL